MTSDPLSIGKIFRDVRVNKMRELLDCGPWGKQKAIAEHSGGSVASEVVYVSHHVRRHKTFQVRVRSETTVIER